MLGQDRTKSNRVVNETERRKMVKYIFNYISNGNTEIHLELVSIVKSQFLAPYHYLVGCSVLSQTLAQIPPIMALLEYLR